MKFTFDYRPSDSSFVEFIWHTQSEGAGPSFISSAESSWEMVITKQQGQTTFTLKGPETKASLSPVPESAEIFGIVFKMGTFMSHLPAEQLVNGGINLPEASNQSFWLNGSAWQFPDFDNADTFLDRLVRSGLLAREPVVEAALQGHVKDLSQRSIQRRFLRATGMTHGTIYKIQRARRAMALLEQGVSILDTVDQAGYADQPHLTRELKYLIGQTPAQILGIRKSE